MNDYYYQWHSYGMYPMGWFMLTLMLFFYFLPTWVAVLRQHHNMVAIFLLNLLLGWTALGWIVALIWSATMVQKPQS